MGFLIAFYVYMKLLLVLIHSFPLSSPIDLSLSCWLPSITQMVFCFHVIYVNIL